MQRRPSYGSKRQLNRGVSSAQYTLGYCLQYGIGIPRNAAKAVEWYQKAAEQGEVPAQYSLGYCLQHGTGIPRNTTKAVEWCQKAAAQGHKEAEKMLRIWR